MIVCLFVYVALAAVASAHNDDDDASTHNLNDRLGYVCVCVCVYSFSNCGWLLVLFILVFFTKGALSKYTSQIFAFFFDGW
jgi:hypothetical protein